MDRKEWLTEQIIALEWEMFSNTSNRGGPASCQRNPGEFRMARSSQFMSLSEEVLESYLNDLGQGRDQGRNLVAEKYARMMATTSPAEYASLEHLVPPPDPEAVALIDRIAAIVLAWGEELSALYPHLMKLGRPLHSLDEQPSVTSIDAYFRGELSTYSRRTLELYLEHVQQQRADNINGAETILRCTVMGHGYGSLADAEHQLTQHQRQGFAQGDKDETESGQ